MPLPKFSDPNVRQVLAEVVKLGVQTFVPSGGAIVESAEKAWEKYQERLMDAFEVPAEERAQLLDWINE